MRGKRYSIYNASAHVYMWKRGRRIKPGNQRLSSEILSKFTEGVPHKGVAGLSKFTEGVPQKAVAGLPTSLLISPSRYCCWRYPSLLPQMSIAVLPLSSACPANANSGTPYFAIVPSGSSFPPVSMAAPTSRNDPLRNLF